MDIHKMMSPNRVVLDLKGKTKEQVLVELVEAQATSETVKNPDKLKKAILERESIMSTGIGISIAIPHAKIADVTDFTLAVGRKKDGIDYDSLDGQPVKIIIMIAAPEGQQNTYLRVLAKVTHVLRDDGARAKILAAKAPEEVIALFENV
ncbi:MAG: PTS sugar transporter subunit IIA [Planctomycetes bacterium]|nr:PTS sugar transporter subunit IIA [Planctomycetota bacterium]NUQ34082.1 PTS sugar transporter subunit IIA [Planctomycetaceae bacterium]